VEWLLARLQPAGGFLAVPEAPMPDLLSTATALHALAAAHASIGDHRDRTLDFVDSLWTGKAFCGSWADDDEDTEYTYYALLSLGHLSLP
jgi:prenyltransferase beta subunit